MDVVGTAAEVVFWTCLAMIAYVYVGYPVTMLLLPRRRPHRGGDASLPRVTVVIAAFNEGRHIAVPFVDHTLVEFCAQIPFALKVRGREKKHLLRSAARPLLPASVLDHRKQGFAVPIAIWLRGSMRTYVESFLDPANVGKSGVLQSRKVQEHLTNRHSRRSLNDKQIFTMLMFERWWRRHRR